MAGAVPPRGKVTGSAAQAGPAAEAVLAGGTASQDAAHARKGAQPSIDAADGEVSIQAVTGSFNPGAGILSVFGDALDNSIAISRNAAGTILVNGGAVAVVGGTATVANTSLIQVFGLGGNDTLTLDETNGALPRANLFGGAGNDVLTGGSGGDLLFGQSGNDILNGRGGFDFLFGGADNDVLTGGDGDDRMFGEGGNDRMIWNPGDDTDLVEGGVGTDTAEVNGGNGAEQFTATANGARVRFDRVDPAPFALDIGTTENLVVNMNGGDDTFSATGNLAALIKITVDGGAGNDTILGSNGVDLLLGGDGNDFIDGQQGNDTSLLGAGDDVFQWDPGDGSDTVEGQDGTDTMLFNGSGVGELFEASANGERVRFTRNVGNIVMDLNDVERIELNALGGTDSVTVNDLSGTDMSEIDIDLAGALGGTTGDGQADTVIVNGTNDDDTVEVLASGTSATVVGLSALVRIANLEAANDQLLINGLGGNDTISAVTVPAGIMKLTLDGGAGDDTLLGSDAADVFFGGDGDDFMDGEDGNDLAHMGAGDDTFLWNPGDDNDTLEGQDGFDTLLFNGSGASENIDVSANGERVRFFRDVANVTMDLDDVESIAFKALGGADNIVVGDMSGTDLEEIGIDLAGQIDGDTGDGQVDRVTVNGTQGDDAIAVISLDEDVAVVGLQADVSIDTVEVDDELVINGLGGIDVIDASALTAGQMKLTMNGGLGADLFIGSAGDDFFNGGDGDDVALMGDGDDTFVWNPGDDNDTLEGQAGFDTMLFNGNNAPENIDIAAIGERVRFFRDVANVTMDLNDVERIDFNASGGADSIVVNDLSGTDVTEIDIDLAAVGGGGDGQQDAVNVAGTNGDDVAIVFGSAAGMSVLGLAAQVSILGGEAANDRLVIRALAGDDVIDASGVEAGSIGLELDGGDGDDVLIGGAGNDVLLGGAGDDVLLGNDGDDTLDGGAGDDIIIGGNGTDVEIQGFQAGAGSEDRIDLTSFGSTLDFDWVLAHAGEANGDVILDLETEQMTLANVNAGALHADDFIFA
jgi:Ca2+-binding RTX toxin-like protein